LTFKLLYYLGPKAVIPAYSKSVPSVCSPEVTACFKSPSITNR